MPESKSMLLPGEKSENSEPLFEAGLLKGAQEWVLRNGRGRARCPGSPPSAAAQEKPTPFCVTLGDLK